MTGTILSLVTSELTTARWFWLVAPPCLTATLGFFAGRLFARPETPASANPPRDPSTGLFSFARKSLQQARQACTALEQTDGFSLSTSEAALLEEQQEGLQGLLTQILQRHGSRKAATPAAPEEKPRKPVEFRCEWVRSPDEPDQLPDRDLFHRNFAGLLAAGSAAEVESSLLLIRLDRLEQLKDRFGADQADLFLQRLSQVVLRALRDEDLLCRYAADTLAALLPDTTAEQRALLAAAVQERVRQHHFRLEADGPEVFVTASFGCAACLPGDLPELALNRGVEAVDRSSRKGRNQLHIHDGSGLQLHST